MVWYFLRSNGVFVTASARAAASETGVPLRLAALSCLSPGFFARRAAACRRETGRRCAPADGFGRSQGDAARCAALVAGVGFDIGRIDLRILRDAAGERGKFHRLQKRDQLARVGFVHREVVERHVEIDLVVEQHELARDPRLLGILDQRLAPLRLLDLAGAEQQLFPGRHIRRSVAPRS